MVAVNWYSQHIHRVNNIQAGHAENCDTAIVDRDLTICYFQNDGIVILRQTIVQQLRHTEWYLDRQSSRLASTKSSPDS